MTLFKGEQLYSKAGSFVDPQLIVTTVLKLAEPVTAGNYTTFFIAPFACVVTKVVEIHGTASSSGTLDITKDTGTTAPQGGSSIFASGTFNTAATANTLQTKTNMAAGNGAVMAAGDRLALKNGGTLTSSANLAVQVILQIL